MRSLSPFCFASLLPILSSAFVAHPAAAQTDASKAKGDTTKSVVMEQRSARSDAAMEKWRDDRFGQMIHWGIYSVPGGFYNNKKVDFAAEWIKVAGHIPTSVYNGYVDQFDPAKYDPKAWAHAFKQEGVRYVVITTKHHDGFCLWPSRYTDYSIASTPYKKDLLKPLADAVRAEGIDMGFYYSIIDWHHPDYRAKIVTPADQAAYDRYLAFMKNQLRELLTEFGDIKVLWFDGRWDPSYKTNPQIGRDLEVWLKTIKPGLIINSRVRAYDSIADYESGYERRLPVTPPSTDWEACMTIPPLTWGYHQDPGPMKSPREIVEMLARCASMGGNFLLNIGPRPDGTIRPEETERMAAVGSWLRTNGEAIYGTRGDLALTLPSGVYATRKGGNIYLSVFQWPANGVLNVAGLPSGLPDRAVLLSTPGAALKATTTAPGALTLTLPERAPEAIASVIVLEYHSVASRPPRSAQVAPRAEPAGSLPTDLQTLIDWVPTKAKITDSAILQARESLCAAVASPAALDPAFRAKLDSLVKERGDSLIVTRKAPASENDPLRWVLVNYVSAVLRETPAAQVTAYPGASDFPGSVPAMAQAVTHTITIDGDTDPGVWRSTGLYAAPGAHITIQTDAVLDGKGVEIRIGAHSDSLRNRLHHSYPRLPEVSRLFPYNGGRLEVANAFGGLVYVCLPTGAHLGKFTVTISGAVEAPRYVEGVTTADEWKRIRNFPAPWGELEAKNVIFTVPSDALRTVDDPAKVASFWDEIVASAAEFAGRPAGVLSFTHGGDGSLSRKERYVADIDISAGGMHAGYPIMTFENAVASELDPSLFQSTDKPSKRWGLLHELGHNYQTQLSANGGRFRDWTTGDCGEVTNNMVPLYICSKMGMNWQAANSSLLKSQQTMKEMQVAGRRPWNSKDLFVKLFMYVQLGDGLGWEPIHQVMQDEYRLPDTEHPATDEAKRDQWLIRLSRASGKNLGPFFEQWGFATSPTARSAVANLPVWIPKGE